MYYLVLFIDYRPFLVEKINKFINTISSDVFICNEQGESHLNSVDYIPSHQGQSYSHPWYIHGDRLVQQNSHSSFNLPILRCGSPKYKISFNEIDEFLDFLSTNYSWSIFPFAGPRRFLSFGFISREQTLRDYFLNLTPNVWDVESKFGTLLSSHLLIASYEVDSKFSLSAKAILFGGYYEPAERLWNVCECNITPPWLITDLLYDDTFLTIGRESVEYKFIQQLAIPPGNDRPLGVYQPLNQYSFESMCLLSFREPDTLVFVPQGTDLEKLQSLLVKTEGCNSYSDLIYLHDILLTTQWFYGLDRDRVDYGHSIFVAQDNTLLQKFNSLNWDDDYYLLACF
ncbi:MULTISPECIES: hypothetical protein [Nostocales]|uniref:Uncharacterized protein n=3 Tax=Nostocales TaxID=1161 RepID=A0A0C1R4K4_9CYAN|nr:hypothetical protein [Tolypothrix bouteillei]KAF3889300.1 hypothetical protein DA73_0400030320 [Tolypothrix bouteillei VB521301]